MLNHTRTGATNGATGFALVLSALILRRYVYLHNNHAIQIPFVLKLRDPSLFPHDAFVQTLQHYCSWFWVAIAHTGAFPLPAVLFFVFLITVAGGVYMAASCSRGLQPGSRTAPIAAAVAFAAGLQPVLGGGTIVNSYTEHTCMAMVLLMGAFSAVLLDRPYHWALLWGLGFACNPMYGIHASVYFGLYGLLSLGTHQLDGRWFRACVLALALVGPSLAWSARTAQSVGTLGSSAQDVWYTVAHSPAVLLDQHLFPQVWGRLALVRHCVFLGVVLGCAVCVRTQPERTRRMILAAVAASCVWLGAAYVAAYAVKSPSLLMLHPARGMDCFYAMAGIYVVSLAFARHEAGSLSARSAIIPTGALLGVALVLGTPHFIWTAGFFCLLMVCWLGLSWRWRLRTPPRAVVGLLCAALCMKAGLTTARRLVDHQPVFYRNGVSSSLVTASDWARLNTQRGASFVVDPAVPELCFFRVLAQRSVFVTLRDGCAILWDADYATQFEQRLHDLGVDLGSGVSGRLDQERSNSIDRRLSALSWRHEVQYALLDNNRRTAFPVLFANDSYRLVALSQGQPRLGPTGAAAVEHP